MTTEAFMAKGENWVAAASTSCGTLSLQPLRAPFPDANKSDPFRFRLGRFGLGRFWLGP